MEKETRTCQNGIPNFSHRLTGVRFLTVIITVTIYLLPTTCPAKTGAPDDLITDFIVISANRLAPLHGVAVDSLRLFSFNGDVWMAIPFQIDEQDEQGRYIFPGDKSEQAADSGILSPQDELVFMVADLGDVAPSPPGFDLSAKGVEIKVNHPFVKGAGFAYLYSIVERGAVALSKVDYISYHKTRRMVISEKYLLRFAEDMPAFPVYLAMTREGGGIEANILEGIHMEFRAKLFDDLFKLKRTEKDINARVTGVIDGPVRIVYRIKITVNLLFNLKTFSLDQYHYFSRGAICFPLSIQIPFDADKFVSSASLKFAVELNRAASGIKLQNAPNTAGAPIEFIGRSAQLRRNINSCSWPRRSGFDHDFSGGWVMNMPFSMGDLVPSFYLRDDRDKDLATFMTGYTIDGLEKIKSGWLHFGLNLVHLPEYTKCDASLFLTLKSSEFEPHTSPLVAVLTKPSSGKQQPPCQKID